MMKVEDCFQQNKSTLKAVSYDDKNNVYMTESSIPVYDFDGIKDWYWENIIKSRLKGPSNDALYIDGDRMLFIEFKNGNISSFGRDGLVHKLHDSLLMLLDEELAVSAVCKSFKPTTTYTRKYMEYILVYNKDKHPNGENNRRCIADSLNKRIRFGLGIYEGFLFSKVRTFTIEEFEKYFVSKIDKLNQ